MLSVQHIWLARAPAQEVTPAPGAISHPEQGKDLVVVVGRVGQRESHPEQSMQGLGSAFLWHKQTLESASPTQQDVSKYLTSERMNDR